MVDYIIKESSIWGWSCCKRDSTRTIHKRRILQNLDHYKRYAFKPSNQLGPAHERQTFIVSYQYVYDYIESRETDFINQLHSIDLRFYKENCMFRGHDAYRILIMDTEVDLDAVLVLLREQNL
jgi:hypothetical protein